MHTLGNLGGREDVVMANTVVREAWTSATTPRKTPTYMYSGITDTQSSGGSPAPAQSNVCMDLYCRSSGGKPQAPWCYRTDPNKKWKCRKFPSDANSKCICLGVYWLKYKYVNESNKNCILRFSSV